MNHKFRNKRVSVLFLFVLSLYVNFTFVQAYVSPGKPTAFVNDFAQILTTQTKQAIESKLVSLEKSNGVEISVVTVNSLAGDTIENYAVNLFQEWGIGKKEKNNGLLILVAPNEREVRIEVGYGLEGTITDLQSANIINKAMLPAFKAGDYNKGIQGAVDAVSSILTNAPDAQTFSTPPQNKFLANIFNYIDPYFILFIIFIIFNVLAKILGKTKSWWLGGIIGAGIGTIIGLIIGSLVFGIILVIIFTLFGLMFDYFVSKRPPDSKGGGTHIWPLFFGGGRGGSGSSGGGFGGFGGGFSGGGGASGRW